VIFNGTSACAITGDSILFSGFQYVQGDIGDTDLLVVSGSHTTVTQCNFPGCERSSLRGLRRRHPVQRSVVLQYRGEADDLHQLGCSGLHVLDRRRISRHTVLFVQELPRPGGDAGNEPIRLGVGEEKTNISRTVVEFCYFENVGLGDSESISIKCAENVCRYNTFNKNVGGLLVFRQGYRNVAYGNFFINGSGGIRLKAGDTDFVYNNYSRQGRATLSCSNSKRPSRSTRSQSPTTRLWIAAF